MPKPRVFSGSHLFLPHRFIFDVASGPGEGWSPEGMSQGGVSEGASETLAEELRSAAAAQKRDQKSEGKAKKRDSSLAGLISGFIQAGGTHDDVVLLVARLLKRETPTAVVVAILSLIYVEFQPILAENMEENQIARQNEKFDEHFNALVPLGPTTNQTLDAWADLIFSHASFYPMQTIMALAHAEGVNSSCLQLTSFMIRDFLESQGQKTDFEKVQQLSDMLWRTILKKVHSICKQRSEALLSPCHSDRAERVEESPGN